MRTFTPEEISAIEFLIGIIASGSFLAIGMTWLANKLDKDMYPKKDSKELTHLGENCDKV